MTNSRDTPRPNMWGLGLVLTALTVLAGCKETPKPNAKRASPVTSRPIKASPVRKSVPRGVLASPATAPVTLRPSEPYDDQPVHAFMALDFLGWSKSGHRLAILATHGTYGGSLEETPRVVVVQVHDTLTGQRIVSFRSLHGTNQREKPLEWDEAKPAKDWARYRAAHPLARKVARRQSPDKRHTVRFASLGNAARLKLLEVETGAKYSWVSDASDKPKRPQLAMSIVAPNGSSRRVLRFRVPVESRRPETLPLLISGEIKTYWSPDSRRVVAALVTLGREEFGGMDIEEMDARYYVRTAGPQILLTCAKDAKARALRLAKKLAAQGSLSVTWLKVAAAAPKATAVTYWRDNEQAARRVAAVIGGSPPPTVKRLSSKGWVDIAISLR